MSSWFENLPTNAFPTIPKAWNDVHSKNYFVAENLFNLASLFHGRTFAAERPQVAHPCFRETLNRSQFQTIPTHAERRQHVSSETTKQIILNMYIDDFVLISDSVEEAKNFSKEPTSLFMKRVFNLTGVMGHKGELPSENDLDSTCQLWLGFDTLGVQWDSKSD
ncbi:hypothetical protein T11_18130 [Trichinella zimbabwensis]|uniref:Uncharacterized protein n=1 Tax=Trichinella zimbabwensis TaxID=268475 RepID=A0A0V1H5I4_9BILA|nr:hypothetical protein T11_18130 [Trichinella zimbabwensis]